MAGWRDLFTPVSELAEQEPHIIELENLDGGLDETWFERRGPCKASNPLALVEMICQWKYNDSPLEIEEKIGNGIDQTFKFKLLIGRRTGSGIALNKTDARQIAAYNLLLDILKHNEFKKFDLPGETYEEALAYIQSIQPSIMKDLPKIKEVTKEDEDLVEQMQNENPTSIVYSKNLPDDWRGKCIQLCARNDLGAQPVIEMNNAEGPSHNPTFKCIVSFPGLPNVVTMANTKNFAKNWAFFFMYKELEKLPKGPKAGPKKEWGVFEPIEGDQQQTENSQDENQQQIENSQDDEKLANESSSSESSSTESTSSTSMQSDEEDSFTNELSSMSITTN